MKWVSVNNGTSNENFELWEADKKLAVISFSNTTRIARIVSNLGKRLFFFEKKGLLTPKAVFKNEYGIKMGKLELEKPGAQNGYLEIEEKKYRYVFNANNNGELNVYNETMSETLITCNFPAPSNSVSKNSSFLDTKLSSLLLILCWYSFQPKNTHTQVMEAIA
ncbi:hypothetical protein [Ferruginibacter sp.]|nr:hypothetical protein [Ferruginibacter sp.]